MLADLRTLQVKLTPQESSLNKDKEGGVSVANVPFPLQSVFVQFDEDSSGSISPFELSLALEAIGMKGNA